MRVNKTVSTGIFEERGWECEDVFLEVWLRGIMFMVGRGMSTRVCVKWDSCTSVCIAVEWALKVGRLGVTEHPNSCVSGCVYTRMPVMKSVC